MSFHWKTRSVSLTFVGLFSLLMLSPDVYPSAAASSATSQTEVYNPELLRDIARTIISRTREQVRLKEKLSKHDATMIAVWKSGKKWGELDQGQQNDLTRHIPKSQVQSILKRERHALMSPEILETPEKFAMEIIEKGVPSLQLMGERKDRYGIKISYDMKPKVVGCNFIKTDKTIEEAPETKIYISFDVTDIIQKIGKDGKGVWNKENDGEVTTLCVDG